MCNILILVYLTCFGNVPAFSKNMPDVVYLSIENRIPLNLYGSNPEDILIKVTPGNVYKRDDSTYAFVPQIESEELKIKLYYKKVLCEVKTVVVKKMPDVVPVFTKEIQGRLRLQDIPNLSTLTLQYPAAFPDELKSTVVSFGLSIMEANSITVYAGNLRGDKLDEHALKALSSVGKNARLILHNIVVQNPRTGQQRLSLVREVVVTD